MPKRHCNESYIYCAEAWTAHNTSPTMTTTVTSSLSWFEEWLLYFEWLWGRTATSFEALKLKYGKLDQRYLTMVYDDKLRMIKECSAIYPAFATLSEDEALKGHQWMDCYKGKRPIMWDMTDLPIPKPSDAETQSNTHSTYYGGNVAKGGISLQQCRWIRLALLWQGAVTDSDYILRARFLEQQKSFIEIHDRGNSNVKFLIIVDKGFRITWAAWATGNQTVLPTTSLCHCFTRISVRDSFGASNIHRGVCYELTGNSYIVWPSNQSMQGRGTWHTIAKAVNTFHNHSQ